MSYDSTSDPSNPHTNPICRCCNRKPFTVAVRVGRDIWPDECVLLCDGCADFVIEVCETITALGFGYDLRAFLDGG